MATADSKMPEQATISLMHENLSEIYADLDPATKQSIFCYKAIMTTSAGIWLGNNPLEYSFPILLFQLIIIFVTTRATHAVLRHAAQPLVISQLIGGIILGPTFLGRSLNFEKLLYSTKSWEHLNTISTLSFMLFIFLIGIKTDLSMIKKAGKKAVAVAIMGTGLSFNAMMLASYFFRTKVFKSATDKYLVLTFAFKWCMTSFCVLACTLNELSLLTSKIGRLAMSAALIADFVNFAVGAGITAYMIGSQQKDLVTSICSFVSFVVFMLFIVYVARPMTLWFIRKTPDGSLLDEPSLVAVISMAILCGFISETIGLHVGLGPFLLGIVLPGGAPLGVTLVEKMERLVAGIFLPLYIAQAGLRVDLGGLEDTSSWIFILFLLLMGVVGKFIGAISVCLYCRMTLKDAFALGLIMIHKGILEVDAAAFWLDARIIDRPVYSILILCIIVLGGGTAPLIKYIYRPEDRFVTYKRRTVQHMKPCAELRILACLYHQENVHSILSLLESTYSSPESPICIYVLHLTQLAGRAAAVIAPYKRNKRSTMNTETDHIVNAFNYYAQQNLGSVVVLPFVCLSPYATMHDDICSLAMDKKASIIMAPFHTQMAIDGTIESLNPAIQNVNINVLHYAPCSFGIFIYNGINSGSTLSAPGGVTLHRIAVYFLGGADDREALAYGMRMAENPIIGLTLVRFKELKQKEDELDNDEAQDEAFVENFRGTRVDNVRIIYREETVTDGEDTVAVIRAISTQFNLLIVGRREGKESKLTEGLSVWKEYPELGVIGDLLASTDFGGRVSTLVVQQQTKVAGSGQAGSPKAQHKGQVAPSVFEIS